MIVALIGSSMLKPGARFPKPCHFSLARRNQSSRLMPSAERRSGPQTLNHQSLPHSSSTLRMARRKSSASISDSSTSAVPPGGSIIAADTSQERDDRVLRRRRRVHQVGLVEAVAVELLRVRILHDDLRRLRDARQQLVRRVRRKDQRLLAARPIVADRVHVAIELMEGGVRQPRLVEVQRLDTVAQGLLEHLDVIGDAVVGALGQRQDPGLLVLRSAGEGIGLDALADVLRPELLSNEADDAQVIARRQQEHGIAASHSDRVQDRFMAVTVDHDDVIWRHGGVPHDFVSRRRAIGDKVTMVRVEDAGRVTLGSEYRSSVVEELTQFIHRIAHVGTQHVFTEELVEHLSHGALEKRDTPECPGQCHEYLPSCAYSPSARKNGGASESR